MSQNTVDISQNTADIEDISTNKNFIQQLQSVDYSVLLANLVCTLKTYFIHP
jgi:hypothetical protein